MGRSLMSKPLSESAVAIIKTVSGLSFTEPPSHRINYEFFGSADELLSA
jgi:hypothetical protein